MELKGPLPHHITYYIAAISRIQQMELKVSSSQIQFANSARSSRIQQMELKGDSYVLKPFNLFGPESNKWNWKWIPWALLT